MASLRRILFRLRAFLWPGHADDDLRREMASHLALIQDDLQRRGVSPEDARLAARKAFGGAALAEDVQRDARSFIWLEDARRDVRYALRTLGRNRGFAAAAIATLALGIGASTAIFSVAYGVALRPLPYQHPDRLVRIYEANLAAGTPKEQVSEVTFREFVRGAPSLASAAIYSPGGTRFLARVDRQPITTTSVSTGFFDVLGVAPALGAGFTPESRWARGAVDEIVLSFEGWNRLFGGRPDVVGRLVELAGAGDIDAFRVVGVMPEGFAFGPAVDFWTAGFQRVVTSNLVRNWRYDSVIARLAPDASIDRLRAELTTVAARLARDYPASNRGWSVTVESLHDSIVGGFGRATWLLLAAVAVVLLVTSLNVGGLLAARGFARERETTVRAALGAGVWRLRRMWMTEASVLSALGAGAGVLLAWSGVEALKVAAPPGIPRLDAVAIDLPALAVAAGAAVLSVGVFSLSSFRRSAFGLADSLRGAGVDAARAGQSTRMALTVAQCAGAATLVVLAALLTRSLVKLTAFDLGWDPDGVLSAAVTPPSPPDRMPWFRYVEWSDRLIARLEATPGIQRAAITTQVPLSPRSYPSTLARGRGKQAAADSARWPGISQQVTDGYFRLMGLRLVAGRPFGPEDRFTEPQMTFKQRPERGVAIVSESTARALWPGRSPIGETLWLPDADLGVAWREVVGVVEDFQFHTVGESPALHVFVPWTQNSTSTPDLLIKGDGNASDLAATVRAAVEAIAPGTYVDRMIPLDALVARATTQPRFTSRVVSAFGVVALVLAAVGIHGTLSMLVAARTREIGVRLTLGAARRDVIAGVVRRGVVPAMAGGLAGLVIALALARTFRALLFEVEPLDLASFAGGAAVLLLAALVATLGPARRVSRIDPARALRFE